MGFVYKAIKVENGAALLRAGHEIKADPGPDWNRECVIYDEKFGYDVYIVVSKKV